MEKILYRGLAVASGKMVYGLPSYGYDTEEINEIGTSQGEFVEIIANTLGEFTGYHDKRGNAIYTGDITRMVTQSGEIRLFEVKKTFIDRELIPLPDMKPNGKNIVRLHTYVFEWDDSALLPNIDYVFEWDENEVLPNVKRKICDTEKMEVVGNIHQNPGMLGGV